MLLLNFFFFIQPVVLANSFGVTLLKMEELRQQILDLLAVEPPTPAIERQVAFLQGELEALRRGVFHLLRFISPCLHFISLEYKFISRQFINQISLPHLSYLLFIYVFCFITADNSPPAPPPAGELSSDTFLPRCVFVLWMIFCGVV